MITAKQIAENPALYPHKFDAGFATLEFLRLKRPDLSAATFLDDNNLAKFSDRDTIPVTVLEELAKAQTTGGQTPKCAMIFHSAFCCSTLIARCLDIEGAAKVLKEPQTLIQLADLKRAAGPDYKRHLRLILGLYARPAKAGERVLIKPGNIANNLIGECLESGHAGNVILLYSNLETFLKSIIKKGLWGHIFARKLFLTIRHEAPFSPELDANPLVELADLQVAALAWYAQISVFQDILARYPADRVKSLDCEVFLNAREATLLRAADFLGISAEKQQIQAILGGSVGQSHAKEGGIPFSPEARQAENEAIEKTFGEQLGMVTAWAGEVARPFNFPATLPNPLSARSLAKG